jgi:hypothetical protein
MLDAYVAHGRCHMACQPCCKIFNRRRTYSMREEAFFATSTVTQLMRVIWPLFIASFYMKAMIKE